MSGCGNKVEVNLDDPFGLSCNPAFDLSGSGDGDALESTILEPIEIAGAPINVFKLLGVHEQGLMIDLTGSGRPISSSAIHGSSHANVFDEMCGTWVSQETGNNVLNSWIGYDFGPIKTPLGANKYSVDTRVDKEVGTIAIQQSSHSQRRATKVRVERSQNGVRWYGADIVDLPDSSELVTVHLKHSAPSRYWRIRPVTFNGTAADMPWEVQLLALYDYQTTMLTNLQDEMGMMESRDRDYAKESVRMKMYYDLFDARTELSKMGVDMSGQVLFAQVGFKSAIRALGRPFVIGDIIEIPSEAQYDPTLKRIKKYMTVTDVAWSIDGYTPDWKPVLQRLILSPTLASQETMDIFQDIEIDPDDYGFQDTPKDKEYVDLKDVNDRTRAFAQKNVPEKGFDVSERQYIDKETAEAYEESTGVDPSSLNYNPTGVYVEDGLPPNGETYTQGDEFPDNQIDGAYHRLTYTTYNDNIPPRLFRYSSIKSRWIYCETDRRAEYNRRTKTLDKMIEENNE